MRTKQRHVNCQDVNCKTCLNDALMLQQELETRTNCILVDHLGHYHRWLTEHGIPAETEWGWPTAETYDEINIKAYIDEWILEKDEDEQKMEKIKRR